MIIKHILLAITVVTAVGVGTSQAAAATASDKGDKLVSSSAPAA